MVKLSIQRPVGVWMCFLALTLVGVLGFRRLSVDLLPSITYPRLTVITSYADIPAEDVERLVTQPLEEVITALTGVRAVVSRTREGVSTIAVQYEWGTEMDFANLHLREALDRVAFRDDFPERAERPVILRWDPSSRPISILVLEGERRLEEITEFAREVVKPALEQVDGVSQAQVVGGAEREILVRPDPRKLAIYGIEMADIAAALARSNISFPGGKVRQGPLHLSLRIDGEFQQLDDIRATDVARPGQAAVRVGDIAEVIDTTKDLDGLTLLGDDVVVSLLIYKEPESNTVAVSRAVDEALEVVRKDFPGLQTRYVYRDAEYVQASFSGLYQSLLLGGGLSIAVLFLFLSDVVSPLLLGLLSIPIPIIITFGLMYFGNVRLNLMSLGGLSLAAGMVVDNAIVVLENINRLIAERRNGAPGAATTPTSPEPGRRLVAEATWQGTSEMVRPVLGATLTTIAVFFPVVYVPGIAGAFFRDQALTVTLSLLVSITTALFLLPATAARVLRPTTLPPRGVFRWCQNALDRFHHFYHGLLVRALGRPWPMLVGLVVALGLSAWLATTLDRRFLPEGSQGNLRLDLELPPGTPIEETASLSSDLGAWIEADPHVQAVFTQVGQTERTLAAMEDFAAPHTARMRIILHQDRSAHEHGARLQAQVAQRLTQTMSDVRFTFREEGVGLAEVLAGGGGAAFQMGIIAEEPLEALRAAESIQARLADVAGLRDLQLDRVLGTPNVVVEVDREEVMRLGLDPERIAQELRGRIGGVEATTFNEVEQRIDVSVRFAKERRQDLAQTLDSPVTLPGGQKVALRSLLRLREEQPVRELIRRDQRRMVVLSAELDGRGLDDVWKEARATVAAMQLPPSVRVIESGEREEMSRSFRDLALAMVLAVLLVYMIMAAQFESFLDPLLISATIPIGLAGSVIAIAVAQSSLNVLSLIGVLALLGIVVDDAIVKVDTIQRLRESGVDGYTAILEAARLRLRPILLVSITTVLGVVPMAIGLGSGAQLQRPLAITIIGGLSLSTSTTLFYTPVLYMLAHRIKRPPRS